MSGIIVVSALGGLAGLHAATWGARKDGPFEGFRLHRFLRSVWLGGVIATALWLVWGRQGAPWDWVLLVGASYALERLATEWWKAIVRENDQSAYAIPMRLACRGKTVDGRLARHTLGAAIVGALGACCWVAVWLEHRVGPLPTAAVVAIGGAGGWLTALGGAWKDAPIEGFEPLKFWRSPVVASLWAAPLSALTHHWTVLAVSAAGYAVATVETHKTFFSGGRPPGKFAGKPATSRPVGPRMSLGGLHAALWLVLGIAIAHQLTVHRADGSWRGAMVAPMVACLLLAVGVAAVNARSGVSARARPAAHASSRRRISSNVRMAAHLDLHL
jgi:hypothetical protein